MPCWACLDSCHWPRMPGVVLLWQSTLARVGLDNRRSLAAVLPLGLHLAIGDDEQRAEKQKPKASDDGTFAFG